MEHRVAKLPKSANGNPTKSFFVRMITRDITLEDCILDLVDNSIDGAWKAEGGRPASLDQEADLSAYTIDLVVKPDLFSITDNCGGIPLTEAQDYAFTFGRRDVDEADDFSIGVYGIGMKRAVFKMGRKISVTSTYREKTLKAYEVPIDVDDWLKPANEHNWDFDIYEAKPAKSAGVHLVVKTLTDETAAEFGSPNFIKELRKILGRDYTLHLHYGVKITLNGVPIAGASLLLRSGGDYQPIRSKRSLPVGKGTVQIEIIAGMGAPPPESNDADEANGDERWGWYVICNGRVVLAGDKTSAAGWGGDGWPQWHGQYNGFIGIVLFSSADAELLPLTTTKRSIDTTSIVFRSARPNMRDISKQWTQYTNVRKPVVSEAKKLEDATISVPFYQVPMRAKMSMAQVTSIPIKPKQAVANINYTVSLDRYQKLALALGDANISYREIGLKTFDYTYLQYVGRE